MIRRMLAAFYYGKASRASAGQAMTEVVLLFPIFMFFMLAMAKIFALMILVQKMEIAAFYAARRWQLESHRNVEFDGADMGSLKNDIWAQASKSIGYGTAVEKFMDLAPSCPNGKPAGLVIERTQIWNVVTMRVCTKPVDIAWMYHSPGWTFEVVKYVPNRDRPINFTLPGSDPNAATPVPGT